MIEYLGNSKYNEVEIIFSECMVKFQLITSISFYRICILHWQRDFDVFILKIRKNLHFFRLAIHFIWIAPLWDTGHCSVTSCWSTPAPPPLRALPSPKPATPRPQLWRHSNTFYLDCSFLRHCPPLCDAMPKHARPASSLCSLLPQTQQRQCSN